MHGTIVATDNFLRIDPSFLIVVDSIPCPSNELTAPMIVVMLADTMVIGTTVMTEIAATCHQEDFTETTDGMTTTRIMTTTIVTGMVVLVIEVVV
jgi:hypothetical protein